MAGLVRVVVVEEGVDGGAGGRDLGRRGGGEAMGFSWGWEKGRMF